MNKVERKIVHIDEEKCDGCALCIPNCQEGAIEIIDGKARLVAENLCDGLGDCLGECPQGAITIKERLADEFEEEAVEERLRQLKEEKNKEAEEPEPCASSGCPGARSFSLKEEEKKPREAPAPSGKLVSELMHWPVQLHLVSPKAPFLHRAKLLVAADCVPFAYPDFHRKILQGHSLVIACPKLDDTASYAEKLAQMIINNDIPEITVAHMEVPCCSGLVKIVEKAIALSGQEVDLKEITVSVRGEAVAEL